MEENKKGVLVGKGAYGSVFLKKTIIKGIKIKDNFAVKEIENAKNNRMRYQTTEISNKITNDIFKNDNLAIYEEVYYDSGEDKLYLSVPYYNGGPLNEFIEYCYSAKKEITIEMIQHIMKHVIHGLRTLHDLDIMHRDIKPGNLMIDYYSEEDKKEKNILNSRIIIIDYGTAAIIKDNNNAHGDEGTDNYRHPKMNEKKYCNKPLKEIINKELDIWSLGMVFLKLLTGENLFKYNPNDIKSKENAEFAKKEIYEIPFDKNKTSIEFVHFIDRTLQYDKKNQADIIELCKDDFIKYSVGSLTKFTDEEIEKLQEEEKLIKKNDKQFLVFNFKKYPNLDCYGKIERENIDDIITRVFISLTENSLFTEQILLPIIPK